MLMLYVQKKLIFNAHIIASVYLGYTVPSRGSVGGAFEFRLHSPTSSCIGY